MDHQWIVLRLDDGTNKIGINTEIGIITKRALLENLENNNFHLRFLGDDYINKKFTGDHLNIKLYFINRDHGWSTTKYKKLISESIKKD